MTQPLFSAHRYWITGNINYEQCYPKEEHTIVSRGITYLVGLLVYNDPLLINHVMYR